MKLFNLCELQAGVSGMTTTSSANICRIRLDFRFGEMVCIRDFAIKSNSTLDELHAMIQACGNWLNYHLYSFDFLRGNKQVRAELPMEYDFEEDWVKPSSVIDSRTITVAEAMSEFPSMVYSYDFRDGWEIAVIMLGFLDSDSVQELPICLFGKGDWPPEDVGGEGGFMQFIEALKDPHHEDYNEYHKWAESAFFEKYSLARCNKNLSDWEAYRLVD